LLLLSSGIRRFIETETLGANMLVQKAISSPALPIGLAAAVIFIPAATPASAAICPQFLAKYCVIEKDGFKHTDWTNPCFAKDRGVKVLHMGECKGK
jgi:hypothetical protein